MKFLVLIVLLAIYLTTNSKEVKIKKSSTKYYSETYQIDKISKNKDGKYFKIDINTRDTLVSGNYKEDVKSGVWNYFSTKNQVWMTYDYDKKSLGHMPPYAKVDTFLIKQGDIFSLMKVDSPPIYLGFENEIKQVLAQNFRIPGEFMERGYSGTLMASFVVDKEGKMTDFNADSKSDKDLNIYMLDAYKMIKGEWLPARVDGIAVDSKISLIFDILPVGKSSTYLETPSLLVMEIHYFGIKRTVVIEQGGVRKNGNTIGIHSQHSNSINR